MKFYDLEKQHGFIWEAESDPSSLSEWYVSVRYKELADMEVGDICKALRQNIFVDEVVSYAVCFLKEDPLAGDKYDGELISALNGLEMSVWGNNFVVREVISVLREVVGGDVGSDVARDVSCLLNKLIAVSDK